jgi:outer membrane protein OmpA-like peptidoglycan-associated protein
MAADAFPWRPDVSSTLHRDDEGNRMSGKRSTPPIWSILSAPLATLRAIVLGLGVAVLVAASGAGCTNAGLLKSQADDLQRAVEELHAQHREQCAPREVALAETNLDFFDEEYSERDYYEAKELLAVVRENVKKAEQTPACDLDRDHDGIPDADDLCPDDPETVNGYLDEDGCPDMLQSALPPGFIDFHVRHSVYFDTAKHELTPESVAIVREAVRQIQADPNMMLVAEGNTDSVGSDAANKELSIRRAESVKDELVSMGVAANRIEIVGFGESRPIATNSDPAGRAQNRRVDLRSK